MKRSELNNILEKAITFIEKMNFKLPPFAYWSPEDWKNHSGDEYKELRDNMLGWDITDFGSGDFSKVGLLMFTLRNGNFNNKEYIKPYAEKLLITEENQITPMHYHWSKMEDIINRGGGNLKVELYGSNPDGSFSDKPVKISMDGRNFEAEPGVIITLKPGESITLASGQYHKFWGEPGTGTILLGEVSKVNDDRVDNRFYDTIGRFPEIEEDAPILYPLFSEVG